MISKRRLITRLTIRLELYINLIVLPLAVYYGTIAGRYEGEKLSLLIVSAIIAGSLATLFGASVRVWKLSRILSELENPEGDYAAVKLRLLSYPRIESIVIILRWVFGLLCCYLIMMTVMPLSWQETLPAFFILILCIPINSVISHSTTEHLLAPVLMDERIKGIYLPRYMYKLFSVSLRTVFIVVSILIIPLITLGHFLFISHIQSMRFTDLSFHVFIILFLSLAAIFVTVYESNAGIRSGLMMTVRNLAELEKGNLHVEPIPLLTKGEIGVISQYVNILAHSLRNSEEMFSKAFRSSPVGIVIWKIDGGYFLNVNESFTKISGYSRSDVVNSTIREVGLFRARDDYERMINVLVGQGKIRGFDTELCTRSGEIRIVTISAEVIMLWDEPCMIATIEDITEKKILEREILSIGERERQKIGQDLHDDLGPHLIGIEVMSELLKKKIEKGLVPSASEVEKIRFLIEKAIQKTRRLSRGLCPVFLADHGLESLLQETALNVQEVHGITCTFRYDRSILMDDISVSTHIYYIVHEAIHNAIRHGRADRIGIELSYDGGMVTLTISDNGGGMENREHTQGMGLKIMNFRANMIGADLAIDSAPGGGTTVTLSFRHEARSEEGQWDTAEGRS
ncbi:MAG TPA: PAS domain S-box protein [Deltaproteobacteria bacterium]|nr:PAS domain S-box protein [Deltaproteobacteria bacterium]HOS26305.1 PAS domain S-box protein [Deltaproteobacteria bacterium]HQM19702.1 PAS domain S-box protein [Deltaproteobacteria bacterium]